MKTITAIQKRYGINLVLVVFVLSVSLTIIPASAEGNHEQPAVNNQNCNSTTIKNEKTLKRKEKEAHLRAVLKNIEEKYGPKSQKTLNVLTKLM